MPGMALDEANQVGIHLPQTQHSGGGRRYERGVSLSPALVFLVVESVQIPEHRRGRRYTAAAFRAPPPFQGPALPPAHPVSLRQAQHPAQAIVLLQKTKVLHAFPSRQVHQHQRHHHLGVSPTLESLIDAQVTADRPVQPRHLRQA